MRHVRPSGRASRTAMRTITHRDMGLTLQQAVHAGLNVDWSDLETFFGDASEDGNLWVTVCKMLKAENYQGLAKKAASVVHVDDVRTLEVKREAVKAKKREAVERPHTTTVVVIDDSNPYESGESDSWDNCVMPECAKYAQNEHGHRTAKNHLADWSYDRNYKSRNISCNLSQSVR